MIGNPVFNDLFVNELDEYNALKTTDKNLQNWVLEMEIKRLGVDVPVQCCLQMQYHLIEFFKEKIRLDADPEFVNYDSVVIYNDLQRIYGIPIHDGGSSFIAIAYCPWCGCKLN